MAISLNPSFSLVVQQPAGDIAVPDTAVHSFLHLRAAHRVTVSHSHPFLFPPVRLPVYSAEVPGRRQLHPAHAKQAGSR
jgi:hypothetical protein